MSNPRSIEAGTDIAMIGVWDTVADGDPFPRSPGIPALEQEANAGRLLLVKTGGDGGFEADFYVDTEVPEEVRADYESIGDWLALRAPTGKLCYGGVEDYRAKKKRITDARSTFEVAAGDYRIRMLSLDTEKPERELAAAVGVEDYEYWKLRDDRVGYLSCLLVLVLVAAIALGIWVYWWLGLVVAIVALLAWRLFDLGQRGDTRYQTVDQRVGDILGEDLLDDRIEKFAEGKPGLIFEMHAIEPGAAMPPFGFLELYPAPGATVASEE